MVLALAIMGCCVAIQGAEIHEAAELGDLEIRSRKQELWNSCWQGDISLHVSQCLLRIFRREVSKKVEIDSHAAR